MAKYNTFKYNTTPYGSVEGSREAFDFHVLLRSPLGVAVELLRSDVTSLTWSYDRVGGCRTCDISLKRELESYGLIGPEYEIEVWIVPESGIKRRLVWSGFIEPLSPFLARRAVQVHARGFGDWLGRLVIPSQEYVDKADVAEVVTDLLDTWIVPGSKIKRTAASALVQSTGFPVQDINFNGTAMQAIQTCAKIGANIEWGVRADREFFFVAPTQQPRLYVHQGAIPDLNGEFPWVALLDFAPNITALNRLNWVYLQAGDGHTYRIEDGPYVTNRQAEALKLSSAVFSAADAALIGAAEISKANGVDVSIEEQFSRLVGGEMNILTPGQDYVLSTFSVAYPTGYSRDADDTVPSTDRHYSVQSNGQVRVLMPAGDKGVLANYDVHTGGHTARLQLAGVRRELEREVPLGGVQVNTHRWGGYRLSIQSVQYTVFEDSLNTDVQLGETTHALAELLEGFEFRMQELRQGL